MKNEINIGSIIKDYRNINDLTQEGLAERLDISFQQLQNYEYNKSTPPLYMLYKLCEVLNIPPLKFFETEKLKKNLDKKNLEILENDEYLSLIKNSNLKDFIKFYDQYKKEFEEINLKDFLENIFKKPDSQKTAIMNILKNLNKII
jgi:transcriptional regulator with XRE-family HTH domain